MARHDKNHRVKIFTIKTSRTDEGNLETTKKYIHPKNAFLWGYFRDLSSTEQQTNSQNQDEASARLIINRRAVTKEMYVEIKRETFGTQTYQITGVDAYDDTDPEIKLTLTLVKNDIQYDGEEGTDWNA